MGGISDEADEEVDIMAVSLNSYSYRGVGYKNGCISGIVSLINTNFGHSVAGGLL